MTNKVLPSFLCTLLLGSTFLAAVASWIMAVMGLPIHNVLCPEGYRWVSLHALDSLTPSYWRTAFSIAIILGCLEASGIWSVMRRKHTTVNEKLGMSVAIVVFLLFSSPIIVPVFKVNSVLRSVTGELIPSPWFTGVPFALSLIVFISSLSFCLFARKGKIIVQIGELLSLGIQRYALWLVSLSLLNFFIDIVKYIFA